MINSEFTLYETATGKLLSSGTSYAAETLVGEGQSILMGVRAHDLVTSYVASGEIHKMPPCLDENHRWDYQKRKWVDPRTLEDFKTAQWAAIKKARDAAELGGFAWDGSVFDSDTVSQGRIQGAVQLASTTPGFEIAWTLADNSIRVLSRTDLEAVGAAMGIHIGIQHAKARELRPLIDAAQTIEEVLAVVW